MGNQSNRKQISEKILNRNEQETPALPEVIEDSSYEEFNRKLRESVITDYTQEHTFEEKERPCIDIENR